jgi:hypothetical protein
MNAMLESETRRQFAGLQARRLRRDAAVLDARRVLDLHPGAFTARGVTDDTAPVLMQTGAAVLAPDNRLHPRIRHPPPRPPRGRMRR